MLFTSIPMFCRYPWKPNGSGQVGVGGDSDLLQTWPTLLSSQVGVDERSLNSTSLLLYWWIPVPAGVKFEFQPSWAEAHEGATWTNFSDWENSLQSTIQELRPFTTYNLTVYVRIKGEPKVFPPAHFVTATTAEGGEFADTDLTGVWQWMFTEESSTHNGLAIFLLHIYKI